MRFPQFTRNLKNSQDINQDENEEVKILLPHSLIIVTLKLQITDSRLCHLRCIGQRRKIRIKYIRYLAWLLAPTGALIVLWWIATLKKEDGKWENLWGWWWRWGRGCMCDTNDRLIWYAIAQILCRLFMCFLRWLLHSIPQLPFSIWEVLGAQLVGIGALLQGLQSDWADGKSVASHCSSATLQQCCLNASSHVLVGGCCIKVIG